MEIPNKIQNISPKLGGPVKTSPVPVNYYSPFDDLFGLAALLSKPSGSESLSGSPCSDKSCWNEHERERSDSEGSVFGSEKDPSSPTGYLGSTGLHSPGSSPTFGSPPREFEFPVQKQVQMPAHHNQQLHISTHNHNHNHRFSSVPISNTRQPFMTMTYEDFLKTIDNISPLISSSANQSSLNPNPSQIPTSKTRFDATSFLGRSNSVPSNGGTDKKPSARYCVFCKNNGEEEYFYNNHVLKSDNGIIVCPVLRAYQCPICHASGDYAHTIKYCPLGKGNEQEWLAARTTGSTNRITNRITSAK